MLNKAVLDMFSSVSHENILTMFDTGANNFYIKDKDLHYLWCNSSHMQTLNIHDLSDVVNKKDNDFFSHEYCKRAFDIESDTIRTGAVTEQREDNLLCPDGRIRSYVISRCPIRKDGVVTGLFAVCTDVTPLKESKNDPTCGESFFEDLFENAAAISVITDRNGVLTKVNRSASKLFFGNQELPDGIIGRNILDYIYKDDREKATLRWKESLSDKKEVNYQIRMISNDGRIMHLLVSGRPVVKDGKIICFQYQALDMVDQKVHEQNLLHLASIETMSQLAGGFAHDFNNLLTVINGYSEIMISTMDKSSPFYHKIFQISQAGTQASTLTQKILEFSRKHKSESIPVDINEELSNQEPVLKHVIEENIRLTIQKASGLKTVKIDPMQFSKMMLNLVINARDAMPGGGEISISTQRLMVNRQNSAHYENIPSGEYILLTVTDTGVGMSPEMKDHLFDPFFSPHESGKGIGMWTVGNIVKDAGGAVFVESKEGIGTTFRIVLPFSQDLPMVAESEKKENVQGAESRARTILVVEDDDTVRDLVKEILKHKGHTIITARNGGDALQLARQYEGDIDLLITDMVMRRIDGMMMAKKIQTILPGIHIMLMSGYGEDVVKRDEIKDFAFLQKPFLPNELIQKVESLF